MFEQTRNKIEKSLGAWGLIVVKHRVLIFLTNLLLIGWFCIHLPNLVLVTSLEEFLYKDDPIRVTYDNFRHQYGQDKTAIVIVEAENIFTLEFFENLKNLQNAILKNVPHIDDVQSLINARSTYGSENALIVEDLFEKWPTTEEEIKAIEARASNNPMYKNLLITDEKNITTLIIKQAKYSSGNNGNLDAMLSGFGDQSLSSEDAKVNTFLTPEESSEFSIKLKKVSDEYNSPTFKIQVGGIPIVVHSIMEIVRHDLGVFTGLCVVVITLLLLLLSRRFVTIFLPVVVAVAAMACTLGAMVVMNIPMTMIGQIIPSFLLAVGVGNSVHILAIFFQSLSENKSKEESLQHALEHSGLAVILTGITTIAGLLSFTTSTIQPVSQFGFVTAIGIIFTLYFSIVLLPSMLALLPIKPKNTKDQESQWSQRFLNACGRYSCKNPIKVIAVWALFLCLCFYSALDIKFSHDPMTWLPKDEPIRLATDTLNNKMKGGMSLEVIVDTGIENGLHQPETLKKIQDVYNYVEGVQVGQIYVSNSTSVLDIIKELHQALNENNPDFYTIPDDRLTIAQELLLFENSGADDLEDLVDSRFSQARISMKVPFTDSLHAVPFTNLVEPEIKRIFGENIRVKFTGLKAVMGKVFHDLMYSMRNSYMVSVVMITLIMTILLGSLRFGLVSMIPNFAPIIFTLGLMGLLGIPLDAFTILIGSIALGLAVDDTIHFMHNYRRNYARCGNSQQAVMETLSTTGEALLFTSLVLAAGFFVYMLSSMENLRNFGLLTGICILMAFLADALLGPALVTLLARSDKKS